MYLAFTLVHRLEASMAEGKLSAESPVGKALLGASKGDKVTFGLRKQLTGDGVYGVGVDPQLTGGVI